MLCSDETRKYLTREIYLIHLGVVALLALDEEGLRLHELNELGDVVAGLLDLAHEDLDLPLALLALEDPDEVG